MSTRTFDPRKDADDAFQAFLSMGDREWLDASVSSMGGYLFEVEERKGYERAADTRAWARLEMDKVTR